MADLSNLKEKMETLSDDERTIFDVVGSGNSRSVQIQGVEIFRVSYRPEGLIEGLVASFLEGKFPKITEDEQLLPDTENVSNGKFDLTEFPQSAEELFRSSIKEFAVRMADYITRNLGGLVGQMATAAIRGEAFPIASQSVDKDRGKNPTPLSAEQVKKEVFDIYWQYIKQRMGIRGRGGATRTKHNWSAEELLIFNHYYTSLRPIWKKVKKLFKEVRRNDNWREIIKAAYHDLPEDLIERLSVLDPYESSPSSIALEHSARLCEVPPDTYTPVSLKKLYTRSQLVKRNRGKAKK